MQHGKNKYSGMHFASKYLPVILILFTFPQTKGSQLDRCSASTPLGPNIAMALRAQQSVKFEACIRCRRQGRSEGEAGDRKR